MGRMGPRATSAGIRSRGTTFPPPPPRAEPRRSGPGRVGRGGSAARGSGGTGGRGGRRARPRPGHELRAPAALCAHPASPRSRLVAGAVRGSDHAPRALARIHQIGGALEANPADCVLAMRRGRERRGGERAKGRRAGRERRAARCGGRPGAGAGDGTRGTFSPSSAAVAGHLPARATPRRLAISRPTSRRGRGVPQRPHARRADARDGRGARDGRRGRRGTLTRGRTPRGDGQKRGRTSSRSPERPTADDADIWVRAAAPLASWAIVDAPNASRDARRPGRDAERGCPRKGEGERDGGSPRGSKSPAVPRGAAAERVRDSPNEKPTKKCGDAGREAREVWISPTENGVPPRCSRGPARARAPGRARGGHATRGRPADVGVLPVPKGAMRGRSRAPGGRRCGRFA